jgi:hypothetical protein
MELFIVKFLPPRVTSYLSGPNILACILLPKVLHLRCLNVRDHILHPYKTNGKTSFKYFNIYVFLRKQRLLNQWKQELSEINLLLIYS